MFRSFDLALYSSHVDKLLNDPGLRLNNMKISCSFETGYTSVSLNLSPCPKKERKYNRHLRRFIVERDNPILDGLLQSKSTRVIKQHVFPIEEGTIVVVDYQVRNRKAGRE